MYLMVNLILLKIIEFMNILTLKTKVVDPIPKV